MGIKGSQICFLTELPVSGSLILLYGLQLLMQRLLCHQSKVTTHMFQSVKEREHERFRQQQFQWENKEVKKNSTRGHRILIRFQAGEAKRYTDAKQYITCSLEQVNHQIISVPHDEGYQFIM